MAALTGNAINTSYLGLIKTTDNAAIGAVAKAITDGGGNAINLEIGTGDINFTGGNVNFTGSSVSGLDGLAPAGGTAGQVLEKIDGIDYNYAWVTPSGGGGNPGLINDSAADSLISAAFLTPNVGPASANQPYATAIGTNSKAIAQQATTYGVNSKMNSVSCTSGIAIGSGATVFGIYGIQIGYNAAFDRAVGIGRNSVASDNGVSIGFDSDAAASGVGIGDNARSTSLQAVAIGHDTLASANNAVALGNNVTASVADYTTTNNLQLLNYAALNFANDSAAATGGVPLGGIYHTSGALKIRLV